ncbi:MAG TPA: outer membrane beta-barrel family protein [Puia sp.]|nr:outer membrane beta-barrel family protein [Puia sp.]
MNVFCSRVALINLAISIQLSAAAQSVDPRPDTSVLKNVDSSTLKKAGQFPGADTIAQHKVQTLPEFTVKGAKPLLVRKLDRLEYNVAESALSSGNSALEVLSKLPGVSVNPAIGVSVNGKGNIYLLIDGKGQYMPPEQVITILNNLRSENIEKIVVITNPSAKYDAAGSAVIDVITKKEKMKSDVHSTYGNQLYPAPGVSGWAYPYFSAGTDLNYTYGSFKFFGSLDFSRSHEFRNYTQGTLRIPAQNVERDNSSLDLYNETTLNYGLGFNFKVDKKSDINVVFNSYGTPERRYLQTQPTRFGKIGTTTVDSNYLLSGMLKDDGGRYNAFSAEYTFHINQQGTNLYVLFEYAGYNLPGRQTSNGLYSYTTPLPAKSDSFSFVQDYKDRIYAYHLDYVQPMGKHFTLETGVKLTAIRNVNNSTTFYSIAPTAGNPPQPIYAPFNYTETIGGAYANLRATLKKISFQAGIRGEFTNSKGVATSDLAPVSREYSNLFPSGSFQYNLNDHDQLGLTYSSRIARPSYSAFNPNANYSSVLTRTVGDPNLNPQILNNIEVSFRHQNAYLSMSWSHAASPKIDLPTSQQDSGITITDYTTNLKYTNTLYTDINIPVKITQFWQSYQDAGVANNSSLLLDGSHQSNWFFHFSTNQTFSVSDNSKVEVNFNYSSGSQFAYLHIYPQSGLSIGYKQFFLQKRLSVNLNVNDVMGIDKFKMVSDYGYLYDEMHSIKNSRYFRLSATYQFKTGNAFSYRRSNSSKGDFGEKRL